MRQVAVCADMSLSNVQYYYKDKDILLAALADMYFEECVVLLNEYRDSPKVGSPRKQLKSLILFFLDHVEEISDMCRIFRELWAVAPRNREIESHLIKYYQSLVENLNQILEPVFPNADQAHKAVAILVPYFEGYSIVNKALPYHKEETAEILTALLMNAPKK